MNTETSDSARAPLAAPRKNRRQIISALLVGLTLAVNIPARAQSVAPVGPVTASTPAATNPPGQTPDPNENNWRFVTRATVVLSYDDNIFIQPHHAQDDFILHAAPSFAYG